MQKLTLITRTRTRPPGSYSPLFQFSYHNQAHKGEVHITVAIVQYNTLMKREKLGVCSNYLKNLDVAKNPVVPLWITKGSLCLPSDLEKPMILVGPGTGIAPFRSMSHELRARGIKGRIHLFFGNRYSEKDHLYADEWSQLVEGGTLASYHSAFSRDQASKFYVQNRLAEQKAIVWSALRDGGSFLLAG